MDDLQVRLKYKTSDADDWTKVEDKALRKKIQNRLAKRKSSTLPSYCVPVDIYDQLSRRKPGTKDEKGRSRKGKARVGKPEDQPDRSPENPDHSPSDIPRSPVEVSDTQRPPFILGATVRQIQGRLAAPGLSEHRFIRLTQYSVLRACVRNATILSLEPSLFATDDSCSPFTLSNPYPALAPHDLTPTPTQLCTPHHPYLDIIPLPSFRDNVLLAALDEAVEELLCWEIHTESFTVWGEQPWSATGTSFPCCARRRFANDWGR